MHLNLEHWHLFFLTLACWINRMQEIIEDLRSENQVLPEKPEEASIAQCDQRRRLAGKGKTLGRKQLEEVGVKPVRLPARSI